MKNHIVVITGASAGVGRAIANAFAGRGMRIALLARGERGLQGVKAEVEAAGAVAMIIAVDVSRYEQVAAAAQRVETEWGPIDTWVNNAMLTVFSPIAELTPGELEQVTDTTYLGAAYGTMVALKHMRQRNRGTIVQVGSALAYRAIPLQAAYCGAKFALRGFTDALRCELMHQRSKIHVTMVHLSAFNTPQFNWARNHMSERPQPLPPIFQPEVAGKAVVWAAQHRRRELFVGLPAFKAIVGNRIMPALLDRLMARQAWHGQLSGQPVRPGECDNLQHACDIDLDAGMHGRFDAMARRYSGHLWLSQHRLAVVVLLLAIFAALCIWWQR